VLQAPTSEDGRTNAMRDEQLGEGAARVLLGDPDSDSSSEGHNHAEAVAGDNQDLPPGADDDSPSEPVESED